MAEETGLIYLLFSSPWVFAPGRWWFRVACLRPEDGGLELRVCAMVVRKGAPTCSCLMGLSCADNAVGLEFESCSIRKHRGSYEMLE
jgi:hypothetical protein